MVAAYLIPGTAPSLELYGVISMGLLSVLLVYTLLGLIAYRKHPFLWPVFIIATPLAVVLHALGAIWGVFSPVETFEVTEKVKPKRIERVHAGLDEGDIQNHDGTERLVRQSGEEFQWSLWDD
jgi:hypothetical protein